MPKFGLKITLFYVICMALGLYFTFVAVQSETGLFARAEIAAEAGMLRVQLTEAQEQVAQIQNLTSRLSDDFLDLDLLDERVRSVLGMVRTDEIVIQ